MGRSTTRDSLVASEQSSRKREQWHSQLELERLPLDTSSRAGSSLVESSCSKSRLHILLGRGKPGTTALQSTLVRLHVQSSSLTAFSAGFGPILFKQIPYTMAKFAVQGIVAEKMYGSMNTKPEDCGAMLNTSVALGSGVIAGVASAIISHPADTLLSKVNKKGAGGDGSIPSRMINITKEVGVVNLCLSGLPARCVMIGTLTALQFGIFDSVMRTLGAKKFHFHKPAE